MSFHEEDILVLSNHQIQCNDKYEVCAKNGGVLLQTYYDIICLRNHCQIWADHKPHAATNPVNLGGIVRPLLGLWNSGYVD
ncbi:hypothetical protein Hanom_Chr09g00801911 [Helianthus anomalus]